VLLQQVGAFTYEELEQVLESLHGLERPPEDLLEELQLLRTVRHMDEHAVVQMIDSLFELPQVPYALVNAINLYATPLREGAQRMEGELVSWYGTSPWPAHEHYGSWVVNTPNAYGPELSRKDGTLLVRLTDSTANCGFSMPVDGVLTSCFGPRDGRQHNGIDIALRTGTPVRSMFPGVVRFAGYYGSYGRIVVVRHYNGLETFYAHLHRTKVKAGEVVEAGDVLGLGGSTGRSSGPHLHLEVRFKGIPIDPASFMHAQEGRLRCNTLVLKRTRWSFAAYPHGTRMHRVAKGEHLYGIAHRYGTSIDRLCELNGISRRTVLRVGQELRVSAD
jgi:murein DD-endopeptidase MepM/ murein hydrolase activator NlpD